MKKLRLLLITLCVSVLMGSMAVTAYAGGGEEWDGLPIKEQTVREKENERGCLSERLPRSRRGRVHPRGWK